MALVLIPFRRDPLGKRLDALQRPILPELFDEFFVFRRQHPYILKFTESAFLDAERRNLYRD